MHLGKTETVRRFPALLSWRQASHFHQRSASEASMLSPWEPMWGRDLVACSTYRQGLDVG